MCTFLDQMEAEDTARFEEIEAELKKKHLSKERKAELLKERDIYARKMHEWNPWLY